MLWTSCWERGSEIPYCSGCVATSCSTSFTPKREAGVMLSSLGAEGPPSRPYRQEGGGSFPRVRGPTTTCLMAATSFTALSVAPLFASFPPPGTLLHMTLVEYRPFLL